LETTHSVAHHTVSVQLLTIISQGIPKQNALLCDVSFASVTESSLHHHASYEWCQLTKQREFVYHQTSHKFQNNTLQICSITTSNATV